MSDPPRPSLAYDGDEDSLFGSPPSSPSRGRSPTPLALPSGTAQNVGTLALPGSHLVAELPVTPPVSLSLSTSTSTRPTDQATSSASTARVPLQSIGATSRRNSVAPLPSSAVTGTGTTRSRADASVRKSKKGKERAKDNSTTPRPTPPPIPLPSADEPPPAHFFRNQQALLGLAGMVGGVNPANLSKARHTRGTTAENPIVVDDEPSPQPFIGKRPPCSGPSDPSQLPRPTSEQIIGSLLQQKNVLPVVISLLRLLVPGAPSLSQPFPHPYPPSQSPSAFSTRSQSPEAAFGNSAPPLKRRRLNSVPAGAGDWDVPYPFQDGQGPENYRTNWENDRGKQLLADLVQLVQGAARKAAAKAWTQQQHYGREATVNKYYRSKTMYYGLEGGPTASTRASQPRSRSEVPDPHASGSSTPSACASSGLASQTVPSTLPQPDLGTPSSPESSSHLPSATFEHLVESLLAAQQQEVPPPSASAHSAASDVADTSGPTFPSDESTQAFFDSWLDMLAAMPPGDPNEAGVGSSQPGAATSAVSVGADTSTSPTMADVHPAFAIPDCLIDPSLLDLSVNSGVGAHVPSAPASNPVNVSTTVSGQSSAAPSLIDSPTATATSLPDSTGAGPVTPSLDWMLPNVPTTQDMKLLEQWAGMEIDVDVDALLGTQSIPPQSTEVPDARSATSTITELPQAVHGVQSSPQEQTRRSPGLSPLPESTPQPQELGTHSSVAAPLAGQGQDGSSGPSSGPLSQASAPAASCIPTPQLPSYPPVPPVPPSNQATASSAPPTSVAAGAPGAHAIATSAWAKGKAKAIPGMGNGVGAGSASGAGKLERKAVVEKARKMRAALVAEVERAKVALWETTLEQGVLVAMGRELEKGG